MANSYTTTRHDFLKKIEIDSKTFGLHRIRSGGVTTAANLKVNDILTIQESCQVEMVKDTLFGENLARI